MIGLFQDSFQQKHQKLHSGQQELAYIKKMLSECVVSFSSFKSKVDILEKIECIAKAKYSLSVVARYMHDQFGKSQDTVQINTDLRQLFEAAGKFCENCKSTWPRLLI